jgi:signal transduction histidine kinase
VTPEQELGLLRLSRGLTARLGDVRDDERIVRRSLREARDFFGADEACVAFPAPDPPGAVLHHTLPDSGTWDLTILGAFLRGERPRIPFDLLLAPVRRRKRTWAAIALRRKEAEFERGLGWGLVTLAEQIGALLDRRDEERIREVRARLDRTVMEQLRPRDLFYQILDALRSITHYDHSSALYVTTTDGASLELVAEQLAWQKGGSRRIGLKVAFGEPMRTHLGSVHALALARTGDGWATRDEAGIDAGALASLLGGGEEPIEREMICAPIATRSGVIGILKVSAARAGLLGDFELDVLRQFAPHASVAIQYLQMSGSLRGRMIEAERKSAVASIARGVAHDVNNALGSVLPLVQQLQDDLEKKRLDASEAREDLQQVEAAVQYCRRIFRNMTSFAAPSPGRVGHANVRRAVDATLAMLRTSLERAAVTVEVEVAEDLPHVRGVQGDLERLVFNLATNARDAMPEGGCLTVRVRASNGRVELRVRDTGEGMTPEVLERLYEPGFTTKEEGSGLGLAVCRAILWSAGGEMAIESAPGRGTEVRVLLAAAEATGQSS